MNSIVERNIFKVNREVMEGGSVNAAKSNCDIQRKSILGPKRPQTAGTINAD